MRRRVGRGEGRGVGDFVGDSVGGMEPVGRRVGSIV